MITFLLQGLALGLSAAASPGPFQAFLINQTLEGGFRRSAPAAFAPLVSDGPVILVTLLLLNQLPAVFLRLVSLCGGLFILYIAFGMARQWIAKTRLPVQEVQPDPLSKSDRSEQAGTARDSELGKTLRRGVMINLLSPGPYTFWTLVNGPLLLAGLRVSNLHGAAFLTGFYGSLVGGLLVIAAIFHQARRLGPKVVRALSFASLAILLFLGGLLIYRGLAG